MNHHEWTFQRAAYVYLCAALPQGSEIQSNDAAGHTMKQRQMNSARGIRKGWPDMVCVVAGFPEIYIECKAKGGALGPEQVRRGENLRKLGRVWFVAQTLEQIEVELRTLGVPLRATALSAADRDERVAERLGKPRKVSKPQAVKPSRSQLAKVARARAGGLVF